MSEANGPRSDSRAPREAMIAASAGGGRRGKRATAVLATIALATGPGCFGYTRSAKVWSYVGDSLLIAGGGAAIGDDLATKPPKCEGAGCPTYTAPFSGGLVVGAVLVVAGLTGIVFNATRSPVKTDR